MTTIGNKEYSAVFNNYFVKVSEYEAMEVFRKKFKKATKQIANAIAEDIIAKYDIHITSVVNGINSEPTFVIRYLPKRK